MSALKSGGPQNLCQVIDNHADLIDDSLVDVSIPQNGILRLETNDGTITNKNIPFFADFIISGLLATLQAPPNANVVDITSGTYQINGQFFSAGVSQFTFAAGDPINPRIDLIVANTSGTLQYIQGVPSNNPIPPVTPPNTLEVAYIGVEPNASGAGGGFIISQVNLSETKIGRGNRFGQALYWNTSLNSWIADDRYTFLRFANPTTAFINPSSAEITLINNGGFDTSAFQTYIGNNINRTNWKTVFGAGNYDITVEDYIIESNGGTIVHTGILSTLEGRELIIKNTGAELGLNFNIEGVTNYVLGPRECIELKFKLDGVSNRWFILNHYSTTRNVDILTTPVSGSQTLAGLGIETSSRRRPIPFCEVRCEISLSGNTTIGLLGGIIPIGTEIYFYHVPSTFTLTIQAGSGNTLQGGTFTIPSGEIGAVKLVRSNYWVRLV